MGTCPRDTAGRQREGRVSFFHPRRNAQWLREETKVLGTTGNLQPQSVLSKTSHTQIRTDAKCTLPTATHRVPGKRSFLALWAPHCSGAFWGAQPTLSQPLLSYAPCPVLMGAQKDLFVPGFMTRADSPKANTQTHAHINIYKPFPLSSAGNQRPGLEGALGHLHSVPCHSRGWHTPGDEKTDKQRRRWGMGWEPGPSTRKGGEDTGGGGRVQEEQRRADRGTEGACAEQWSASPPWAQPCLGAPSCPPYLTLVRPLRSVHLLDMSVQVIGPRRERTETFRDLRRWLGLLKSPQQILTYIQIPPPPSLAKISPLI